MEHNQISTDLASFLDDVFSPSESFARLFANAYIDTPAKTCINADFMDVALVSSALTSLLKYQLEQFACKLQEQIGTVEILQPWDDNPIKRDVFNVRVAKKEQVL